MTIRYLQTGRVEPNLSNFLQTADSDIIVSLHLVIPFISMVIMGNKGSVSGSGWDGPQFLNYLEIYNFI